jgi:anaerobic ribonucleoside-triphosphate reductase
MNKKIYHQEDLICHDCKKNLLENEDVKCYHVGEKEFFKCKPCCEKDSVLRNFRETEVYSRCVGYIRPVQNWNKGKVQEFNDRVTYKINEQTL